ncbi:MAG: FAD-binding protein, partial [Pseudomonadota bacterium]
MADITPRVVEGAPPLTASVEVLILGAGACGLTAALATEGADVLVAERDAVPSGSTALSAGLIPAAGTRWQTEAGVEDSAARLAEDIRAKSKGTSDAVLTEAAAAAAGPAVTWLGECHGLPFELVDGFVYPGHTARRMHAMPERTGQALIDRLRTAAEGAGVMILTHARAHTLYVEDGRAVAVGLTRPD